MAISLHTDTALIQNPECYHSEYMRIFIFLALLSLSFGFISPDIVMAEGIVPCSGVGDGPSGVCETCHFVQLGNNLVQWLVGAMAAIATVAIVIGGLNMATAGGDTGKISHGKELIQNALIGFVILLAAWLIIDTIMKTLVGDTVPGFGPWNEISCMTANQPSATVTTAPGGGTGPGGVVVAPQGGALTQAQVQAQLGGIQVLSSGNCSDRTNPSCTSLDGIQQGALTEIVGTINSCTGCNLVITAGTEVGHTNPCHAGGTCVDIKCAGGCTPAQVLQVKNSAVANGSRVDYETLDCAKAAAARAQGVTAHCKADPGYGHITGEHFSLYTQ